MSQGRPACKVFSSASNSGCSSPKVSWKTMKAHSSSQCSNQGALPANSVALPSFSAILLHLQETKLHLPPCSAHAQLFWALHTKWIAEDLFHHCLQLFLFPASWNHRMAWVGRDLKDLKDHLPQSFLVLTTMKSSWAVLPCLDTPAAEHEALLTRWQTLPIIPSSQRNGDFCRWLSSHLIFISSHLDGRTSLKASTDVLNQRSDWKIFSKGKISNYVLMLSLWNSLEIKAVGKKAAVTTPNLIVRMAFETSDRVQFLELETWHINLSFSLMHCTQSKGTGNKTPEGHHRHLRAILYKRGVEFV